MIREFASLASFGRFCEERAAAIAVGGRAMSVATARVLEREVKKGYGSKSLEDLADATQADRLAKGFTANDPLLRDGSLLRDKTESVVGTDFAAVGSSEPAALYSEFGSFNVRAGKSNPPRPVYGPALEEAAPAIIEIMEANIGFDLGFTSEALFSDVESKVASYALNVSDKE